MTKISQSRLLRIVGIAVALTTIAELFYLLVWGMWLFPNGNWVGKIVWTMTCGIAMGAVIGVGTLLWAEPLRGHRMAMWRAAAVVVMTGGYCAWLCSSIDAQFGYFGGSDNTTLFIAAGIAPAFAGGALFGWLLYGGEHSTERRTT